MRFVQQVQPAGGQALETPEVTKSRFRLASVTVPVLGALGLVLMAAWLLLASLTRDLQISRDGAAAVAGLACGLVGARYDAEATVAMFAARLKDAVDLDSVRDDLASVVQKALEPDRISVWISPRE